jgi:DNA polymerase
MMEPELSRIVGADDLYLALSTIEDAIGTGLSIHKPRADFLEALKKKTSVDLAQPLPSESEQLPQFPRKSLDELQTEAHVCTRCKLAPTRNNVVFGEGVQRPTVLVVGEGPGAEEDAQGLPFVGASGKLLDKMLAAIGLSRQENCYIANIVKCRPPNNREPAQDEREACMPYLRRQIELLQPKAILCAGRTAAQSLLETNDGINRLRGKPHRYMEIPLVATYHPSALLRDESLKRPAWEDLKTLRAIIENA